MLKKVGAGVFALSLFFMCALLSPAQKNPPQEKSERCADSATQFEMNRCAERKHQQVDAQLNMVYQQLMKESDATEKTKLKAAQFAWIKFRDAHCAYVSAGDEGGSIYQMVLAFCLADATSSRVKQLQEILRERSIR